MKIAYITTSPPFDKYSWSGTNYYVKTALEAQGCEVYCIYEYRKITLGMVFRKLQAVLLRKKYQAIRSVAAAKGWAKFVSANLEGGTDAILSLSTIPVAYLETDIPVFVYVDGCYEYMLGQGFNRLLNKTAIAHEIERRAFEKSKKIFTSSDASADAIRKFYNSFSPGKVKVVPLGANLDEIPSRDLVIANILDKDMTVCRILFVGVDWDRKGADIVIETVKNLHDAGFPIELHLVGLRGIPMSLPPYVVNHGFISKMETDGMAKLVDLYKSSHFLFVPSRGEAYGLVFSEASAYGLPSISHSIGGITTIVKDGENGKLFPLGTKPATFAKYIKETFSDETAYKEFSIRTYNRFEEQLNWNVAGKSLLEQMAIYGNG